jgi:hypothetical protein
VDATVQRRLQYFFVNFRLRAVVNTPVVFEPKRVKWLQRGRICRWM